MYRRTAPAETKVVTPSCPWLVDAVDTPDGVQVNGAPEDEGIIPRVVLDIFRRVKELRADGVKASVHASFLEVRRGSASVMTEDREAGIPPRGRGCTCRRPSLMRLSVPGPKPRGRVSSARHALVAGAAMEAGGPVLSANTPERERRDLGG